jgi:DNA-binding MarR family transcriptional regulator
MIDPDVLRLASSSLLLARALERQVRYGSSPDQLDLIDMSVLRQIERGRDLPSVVARTLRLDPGRVTRITDQLVELEFVRRDLDPADRRLCRLRITPAGTQRLAEAKREISEAMTRLLGELSSEERRGLELGMEGVRRVLDDLADSKQPDQRPAEKALLG